MIKVRAHHGMCLFFFIGKGYSNDFTENMWSYKKMLLEENPIVKIVAELDDICAKCPNNISEEKADISNKLQALAEDSPAKECINTGSKRVCTSQDKVLRYDRAVLQYLGLESGSTMHFKDFYELVEEKILRPGNRPKICGDCSWSELCIYSSK